MPPPTPSTLPPFPGCLLPSRLQCLVGTEVGVLPLDPSPVRPGGIRAVCWATPASKRGSPRPSLLGLSVGAQPRQQGGAGPRASGLRSPEESGARPADPAVASGQSVRVEENQRHQGRGEGQPGRWRASRRPTPPTPTPAPGLGRAPATSLTSLLVLGIDVVSPVLTRGIFLF